MSYNHKIPKRRYEFSTPDPLREASGARFPDVERRRRRGCEIFSGPHARRLAYYREGFEERTWEVTDASWAAGLRYFQERGEAYPSDIEEDLEIDYKLICQIVEDLKREGRLEVL